jgi:hypothetical protein
MATPEGGSTSGGTIGEAPIERDMTMAKAEENSGIAGDVSGETTHVTGTAASELWEWNKNGKRLRSEIPEWPSAPRDLSSRIERTMRQRRQEVAQLHLTVDKNARMQDAHMACEETQWLSMRKWMEDRERKWDAHPKDDVLWGTGISDMAMKILNGAQSGKREREAKNSLHASKHAGTTQ